MLSVPLTCPACKWDIYVPFETPHVAMTCPQCEAPMEAYAFPALVKGVERGRGGEAVLAADESSCFYHADKRAEVACEGCGRFLCGLCAIEFEGRQLCPACIEKGVDKGELDAAQQRVERYDKYALVVALVPMVGIWTTLIGAPAALYLVIRYWRKPLGPLEPSKWRFVVAGLVAVAQLAAWAVGVTALITMG